MFGDTVTVYNKHKDGGAEKWQRTVISGVFWNSIKGAVVRRTGVSSSDSLQLIIPFAATASRRSYAPQKAWETLTDKSQAWTLQAGDIVIRGKVIAEVARSSLELKKYDDCLTITSIDKKDFARDMAHWEVSAK